MKKITAIVLLSMIAMTAPVYGQTPYYQGKQIRVVVGFTTGGFYDRWARLLARYMPKFIPGNPTFVVQNMPGAGSVIATNYVFEVAKPDGLTIGFPSSGIYLDQLVGRSEVKFDLRKFAWIGSPVTEPMLFYMRSDAPYKSISDIRNSKEPPKCGSTGTVSTDFILARMLEDTLPPLKINTVLGYPAVVERSHVRASRAPLRWWDRRPCAASSSRRAAPDPSWTGRTPAEESARDRPAFRASR